MAANSKIEWTTHTFNPWLGCTKVSPACKHCYAEREFDHHYKKVAWGPNGTRVLTSKENWAKPLKWNRDVQKEYEVAQAQWVADCCVGTKSYPEPELYQFRKRVFCASLADVFEDWQGPILDSAGKKLGVHGRCGTNPVSTSIPSGNEACGKCGSWFNALTMNDVRSRLFALIDATPNLDWLLLTKRPENISGMLFDPDSLNGHKYRQNCWLGCSVENQEYADKRIPELLKCRDLSPVLFLSCEPLLGPVDLTFIDSQRVLCCLSGTYEVLSSFCGQSEYDVTTGPKIDWVIAGGESGPEARPTDPQWFRSIRDQCKGAGVPFLFKQWGEHDENLQRVGKSRSGRMLDGVLHDEFPKVRR